MFAWSFLGGAGGNFCAGADIAEFSKRSLRCRERSNL